MANSSSFRDKQRELNEAEQAHIQAVKAAADQMLGVLNGDRPDPYCRDEAIKKLQECVMWAVKGIEKGISL
jgi:hypothetical protein